MGKKLEISKIKDFADSRLNPFEFSLFKNHKAAFYAKIGENWYNLNDLEKVCNCKPNFKNGHYDIIKITELDLSFFKRERKNKFYSIY